MKNKQMIHFLACAMALTALLGSLGTVSAAQAAETTATMPVLLPPVEGVVREAPADVYPVDLRYTECAVLELSPSEVPDPAEVEAVPPEAGTPATEANAQHTQSEEIPPADALPVGGEAAAQDLVTYRIFRYLKKDGIFHQFHIQVWVREEDSFRTVDGTLTPGLGMHWNSQEVPPALADLNAMELENLSWVPCGEEALYAVNTAMTQSLVMGRRVLFTDDAHTLFQMQSYDEAGVLTEVIPLTQEDASCLMDGVLTPMQWESGCFPTLEETNLEDGQQETIDRLEEELTKLQQQKQRYCILAIVLGVVAGVLLVTNLVTLLMGRKRRKRPGTNGAQASAAPVVQPQCGVVHNIGRRSGQQDSFAVIPCAAGTLAVVADGMGGLADGDKVSQKIVATMRSDSARIRPGQTHGVLYQLAAHANAEVNRMLGAARQYQCGSTLLAVLVENGGMQWITIGDSRIYLYRGGSLLQINREHIYETDLLHRAVNGKMSFAEVAKDPQRTRVSSFVGMGELKHVDACLDNVTLLPGDRILLMSDGVFNALSNDEIAAVITNTPNAQEAAKLLEQQVLQKQIPKQDNFTCVILEV